MMPGSNCSSRAMSTASATSTSEPQRNLMYGFASGCRRFMTSRTKVQPTRLSSTNAQNAVTSRRADIQLKPKFGIDEAADHGGGEEAGPDEPAGCAATLRRIRSLLRPSALEQLLLELVVARADHAVEQRAGVADDEHEEDGCAAEHGRSGPRSARPRRSCGGELSTLGSVELGSVDERLGQDDARLQHGQRVEAGDCPRTPPRRCR